MPAGWHRVALLLSCHQPGPSILHIPGSLLRWASTQLSWQPAMVLCQARIVSAAKLYCKSMLPLRPSLSRGATAWQGKTPLERPVSCTETHSGDLNMLQGCMAPSVLYWGCWQRC